MGKASRWSNYLAGASLGALLGSLVGLSVTPIVGSLLGAASAILASYFALRPPSANPDSVDKAPHDNSSALYLMRISAFSTACLIFIVLGLMARTYGLMEPSLSYKLAQLESVGLSQERALAILFPVPPISPMADAALEPPAIGTPARASIPQMATTGVLYSAPSGTCDRLTAEQFPDNDPTKRLNMFRAVGEPWKFYAESAQRIPLEARKEYVEIIWLSLCSREERKP